MAADTQPDDVRLAGLALRAVAKGGAPVARVGHLPDVVGALHALDAQGARRLAVLLEGLDQLGDGLAESPLLLAGQARELAGEASAQLKCGGHQLGC